LKRAKMKETKNFEEIVQDIIDQISCFDGETVEEIANMVMPYRVKYIDNDEFEVYDLE